MWSGQNRRRTSRRQSFRVAYPAGEALQITNLPLEVIDISIKVVRFMLFGELPDGVSLEKGQRIKLAFKFHNDQIVKVGGSIFRHGIDRDGRKVYLCKFDCELPAELINEEQAFITKKYPDFYRRVRRR
jgi:hypothetical protein